MKTSFATPSIRRPEGAVWAGGGTRGSTSRTTGRAFGSDRQAIFEYGHTRKAADSGGGLRIVKQLVDGHGWDIAVIESEAGGARLEITDVEIVD